MRERVNAPIRVEDVPVVLCGCTADTHGRALGVEIPYVYLLWWLSGKIIRFKCS